MLAANIAPLILEARHSPLVPTSIDPITITARILDERTNGLTVNLLWRVDATNLFLSLSGRHFDTLAAAKAAGAPTLNYGVFLNTIFNFLIVAFSIFLLVRQVNRFRRQAAPAPVPVTQDCPYCCSAISLKAVRCPYCTSELKPEAPA